MRLPSVFFHFRTYANTKRLHEVTYPPTVAPMWEMIRIQQRRRERESIICKQVTKDLGRDMFVRRGGNTKCQAAKRRTGGKHGYPTNRPSKADHRDLEITMTIAVRQASVLAKATDNAVIGSASLCFTLVISAYYFLSWLS